MNFPAKLLVLSIFASILFKIEFFPFSNYQMYSELFVPQEVFSYFEITEVRIDGSEAQFANGSYGVFPLRQALIESVTQNLAAGKSPQNVLLSILAVVKKRNPQITGLRLYQLEFQWTEYKKSRLAGPSQTMTSNDTIRRQLLADTM